VTLAASGGGFSGTLSVDFEVISRIWDVKTIAVGSSIRILAALRERFGAGDGENLKAWQRFAFGMVQLPQ
jgi:hypothetical protein